MPGAPSGEPLAPAFRPPSGWRRLRSRRVEVHDESMAPVLIPGDRLLVDVRVYLSSPPVVGHIVVLVDPDAAGRWLIKRVAGVGPGRFWRTRGILTAAPEVPADPVPPPDAIETVTLPGSTLYVTGDAPTARDSLQFGPVPFAALVGRAYYRYAPFERRGEL